jgi:ribosomal protein S18 acetylase RimI-like enzyme
METGDFEPYVERVIREYAADHVRVGRWTAEEGLTKARDEVRTLLSAGLETPNHFLFNIVAGPSDNKVGIVWLAIEPRGGFIYDLLVFESHRRQGYAQEALLLAEGIAREKGARRLSLHVFGDNTGARKLYTALGYSETNVAMSKMLTP